MSGAMIVGALLRRHAPLTALVAPKWIKLGELPEGAPVQAVLIRSISLLDTHFLKAGTMQHSIERVAVLVRAETYREQVALLQLVRAACRGFTGALEGVEAERIAVHTSGLGPDLRGADASFQRTQDFRVSFDAPV
ncbi:hypothetical protein K7957_05080 [Sphingomonas yunnanensis]|uniref:hypothetical protein n=1 Tax=Sphingomonas yunnanensis TaxID=310400 RepID=UPI001CA648DF|nr:hypothetical protein [Sphingomonas yunnanensis]MBY9062302.1 hypothetical protein [Sphingomonas yunnanensis]